MKLQTLIHSVIWSICQFITSCNVTVTGTPAYGCHYKYLICLLLWKVCSCPIWRSWGLFSEDYTLMLDLGALAVFSLYCFSENCISEKMVDSKTKDLAQQKEMQLSLKQTAPALSFCFWMLKNRNVSTLKSHCSVNASWQFCGLEVPSSVGDSALQREASGFTKCNA